MHELHNLIKLKICASLNLIKAFSENWETQKTSSTDLLLGLKHKSSKCTNQLPDNDFCLHCWWNKRLNPTINYSKVYLLDGKLPTAGDPSGDQKRGAAVAPPHACEANLRLWASLAPRFPCQDLHQLHPQADELKICSPTLTLTTTHS